MRVKIAFLWDITDRVWSNCTDVSGENYCFSYYDRRSTLLMEKFLHKYETSRRHITPD